MLSASRAAILILAVLTLVFAGCASKNHASAYPVAGAKESPELERDYNPISRSFDPAPPFGSRRNNSSF